MDTELELVIHQEPFLPKITCFLGYTFSCNMTRRINIQLLVGYGTSAYSLFWNYLQRKRIVTERFHKVFVQSNMYIKALKGIWKCALYEQWPFVDRLKLYALFINGKNEAALYRQWFLKQRFDRFIYCFELCLLQKIAQLI